jgi:4-hydroxy 2-oxovalerate aldolase
MTLKEFQKYVSLADKNLNQEIILGYHSHNNMQLAFSNAISMCNLDIKRDVIIDASIYGIGRGAGNLNTELITDYLNNAFGKKYDTLPLLEVIDRFLSLMMKANPWGFSPAQYLSASFNSHPNYASYLINKNTNHIVGVRKVLEKIPQESRSSFDKELIERLYIDSLLEVKTPPKGSFEILENKNILLVASGKSVKEYMELIDEKLLDKSYMTIALNHKPQFECDYYLFSNQKRFDEFKEMLPLEKVVITSNILTDKIIDTVLDFKSLCFIEESFVTNVAIVAINYLISQNIKKVEIVGLDGYKTDVDNYNYREMNVINDNKALIEQNKIIGSSLEILDKYIDIKFLTPSLFDKDL